MGMELHKMAVDVGRLALWLVILAAIFVPLERLFAVHRQRILRRGILTDLAYYLLTRLLPAFLLSAPVALLAWVVHHAIPRGFLAMTAALPLWPRVLVGIMAVDTGYYWGHRWSHRVPFLWLFHSIHHSAEQIDFLVNTRAHPIDLAFGRFCGMVPLYLLGLGGPPVSSGTSVPVLVILIGTLWGFFIHANIHWRFGPLEWLISTPAFHHWHHTLNEPINRNYAANFPWLDRLFGTYYLPKAWPAAYGVTAKIPGSLVGQLAYPLLAVPQYPTAPPAAPEP